MTNSSTGDWFKTWFNTDYYHLLYKHRDYNEAQLFIDNLLNYLSPSKNDYFLDIACGKGRHAIYLNKKGFCVDGFDLSENSIKTAKKYENECLHFYVNDIRQPLKTNFYDVALNLFTSFGYFDDDAENIKALKAINASLKPNGILVLDFLNTPQIAFDGIVKEQKIIDSITFNTSKYIKGNSVIKEIEVIDNGKTTRFFERVKLISPKKFSSYFEKSNFEILNTYGNYQLMPYHETQSDRLIFICKKH